MSAAGERGAALLVALVTVVVVTMAVLLVASVVEGTRMAFRIEERTVVSTALADAAMAETLARLSEDHLFRGVEPRALGGGTVSSRVTDDGLVLRRVVAVGAFGDWATAIDAEVSLQHGRPRAVRWAYRHGPAAARGQVAGP